MPTINKLSSSFQPVTSSGIFSDPECLLRISTWPGCAVKAWEPFHQRAALVGYTLHNGAPDLQSSFGERVKTKQSSSSPHSPRFTIRSHASIQQPVTPVAAAEPQATATKAQACVSTYRPDLTPRREDTHPVKLQQCISAHEALLIGVGWTFTIQ